MEKLIELLKQKDWYENVDYQKQSDWWYMFWIDGIAYREERICSKRFWFIKWLVENNKIDFSKLEKIWYEKTVYGDYWQYREIVEYPEYISLLMLLSISNSPIEDLISYLK